MKKICFVVFNLSYIGGIERVNSVITSLLAENKDYDITLLSLYGDEKEISFSGAISDSVNIKGLIKKQKPNRGNMFKIIKKIETEVMTNLYDIVITGDLRTFFTFIKVKNRNKFKLVIWEHFNDNVSQSIFRREAKKFQLKFIDKLVVLTEKNKTSYIDNYGYREKILKIYNPYSFEQNISPDLNSKKILTIARLSTVKRLDYIVEIGRIIFNQFPKWSWDIYGEGNQYEFLKELIVKSKLENNIILKGVCYDVKKIYPNYSLFSLTSENEGFGLVLLEAKQCKLPLISFDINCGPSEIIADGLNGYLIPPFNIEMYAKKMMLLMGNEELRYSFSENCQIDFDKFTSSTIKIEWENLLNSL